MKICVLGSHGFLGSDLVDTARRAKHEVVTLPDPTVDAVVDLMGVTHKVYEQCPRFHWAQTMHRTEDLIAFCKEYDKPLLVASSALVYEPLTDFAQMKLMLEYAVSEYPKSLAMRIFPVYGYEKVRGDNATVIYKWAKALVHYQPLIVYGDGTQGRDFVYVRDVSKSILKFLDEKRYGVADIGCGRLLTFNEIIETISNAMDRKPVIEYQPAPDNYSRGIISKDPITPTYSLTKALTWDILPNLGREI